MLLLHAIYRLLGPKVIQKPSAYNSYSRVSCMFVHQETKLSQYGNEPNHANLQALLVSVWSEAYIWDVYKGLEATPFLETAPGLALDPNSFTCTTKGDAASRRELEEMVSSIVLTSLRFLSLSLAADFCGRRRHKTRRNGMMAATWKKNTNVHLIARGVDHDWVKSVGPTMETLILSLETGFEFEWTFYSLEAVEG